MNFEEIKKLLEEDNTKVVVVENGEPSYVIISFGEYKKLRGHETVKQEEKEVVEDPLKIEDMPF